MKFFLLFSFRYIFSKKTIRTINVITWVSIIGVAIGTSSISIVLSVLNGFREVALSRFLVIDSNARIVETEGRGFFFSEEDRQELSTLGEGIFNVDPFIEERVLLVSDRGSEAVTLRAISPHKMTRARDHFSMESFQDDDLSSKGIILGRDVFHRLDINYDDTLFIVSSDILEKGIDLIRNPLFASLDVRPVKASLKGYFYCHPIYDGSYAILSLEEGRTFFQKEEGWITGVDISYRQEDESEALSKVKQWINTQNRAEDLAVETLFDKHRILFQVMKTEKLVAFIMLMIIVVVASIGLMGSLTMTVLEKKKELYYLFCMGSTRKFLGGLFLGQGAMTGAIGISVGLISALLICFLQDKYGMVSMPFRGSFIITTYPVKIEELDVVATAIGALFVTFISSIYPAKLAMQLASR